MNMVCEKNEEYGSQLDHTQERQDQTSRVQGQSTHEHEENNELCRFV